jgi:peptidoglycan/xylan/chitin deacetylase (PgdA/CDA1 family)
VNSPKGEGVGEGAKRRGRGIPEERSDEGLTPKGEGEGVGEGAKRRGREIPEERSDEGGHAVVLMYHGLSAPGRFGEAHYTVSPHALEALLGSVLETRPVADLPALLDGTAPSGSVVFTFDDGEASVASEALPIFQARGVRATVFVTTDWIGTEGYLGPEEISRLVDAGWTVGSHGATHRFLSDLTDLEVRDELYRSRDALAEVLGELPEHGSLPGGRGDARVVRAARRAGYRSLATSTPGRNRLPLPCPFAIRRTLVLGAWSPKRVLRLALGEPLPHLALVARQALLGSAKRLVGNERYRLLRSRAFALLGRS